MQIGRPTVNALRLLICLAQKNQMISAPELSKITTIRVNRVLTLLTRLRAKNLVTSYIGIHGGYTLSRPPKEVRIFDVLETTEVTMQIVPKFSESDDCGLDNCKLQDYFQGLQESIERQLKSATLADFL